MPRRSWLIAVVILCFVCPASAQTPSPDATAAARSLLATMRFTDQFKAILPVIMAGLKPVIVQGRPEVERDFDAIIPSMPEAFAPFLSGLLDDVAKVYASNFTVAELRELEAFYRQPIGQKLLEKTPVVTQQVMGAGQAFGQKAGEVLRARMVDELRKKGHKI